MKMIGKYDSGKIVTPDMKIITKLKDEYRNNW